MLLLLGMTFLLEKTFRLLDKMFLPPLHRFFGPPHYIPAESWAQIWGLPSLGEESLVLRVGVHIDLLLLFQVCHMSWVPAAACL